MGVSLSWRNIVMVWQSLASHLATMTKTLPSLSFHQVCRPKVFSQFGCSGSVGSSLSICFGFLLWWDIEKFVLDSVSEAQERLHIFARIFARYLFERFVGAIY